MEVQKLWNNTELTVALKGRLDTVTAPEAETEIEQMLDKADTLVLDFAELEYMSSTGLRVVLALQKLMQPKSGMKLRNVNDFIMDIFISTGLDSFITFEK